MALEDGTYMVKVSLGSAAFDGDNVHVLNIEGQQVVPAWKQSSQGFLSTLVSAVVEVNDGRLTLDSIGGDNTQIQYLEVEELLDLTPEDGASAAADYSYFSAPVADSLEDGQVSIAIGEDGSLPIGIDPTATFVVGVVLHGASYRGPNIVYTDDVRLIETQTGEEVSVAVQISGGADSINIRPLETLEEFTSYTLIVDNVLDLGSVTVATDPLRQMNDLTATFVTGAEPRSKARLWPLTQRCSSTALPTAASPIPRSPWAQTGGFISAR